MRINFDMDGTIADLYGVENWLSMLINEDTTPYEIAKPMINFSYFARLLHKIQNCGIEIAIISWTPKNGSIEYNEKVAEAKKNWLNKHLPSVEWDEIIICPYGTPKSNFSNGSDILFDDELNNRQNWFGFAFDETELFTILKSFL